MEIFQVADKGLNCARNIYAATKEADDGYIFSKSIHGRNLSEKEKKWLLLENDQNIWKDYRDKSYLNAHPVYVQKKKQSMGIF